MLDMDEVNTLSNLRERSKIYAMLELPEGCRYQVLSVIGSGRKNVKAANQEEFELVSADWPSGMRHEEMVLPSWISWSDDEEFFDRVGICAFR